MSNVEVKLELLFHMAQHAYWSGVGERGPCEDEMEDGCSNCEHFRMCDYARLYREVTT